MGPGAGLGGGRCGTGAVGTGWDGRASGARLAQTLPLRSVAESFGQNYPEVRDRPPRGAAPARSGPAQRPDRPPFTSGSRWHVGLHQHGPDLHLQPLGHAARRGLQRRSHRHLGFPHQGNRQNHQRPHPPRLLALVRERFVFTAAWCHTAGSGCRGLSLALSSFGDGSSEQQCLLNKRLQPNI